jgi:SAM-dependent methyltransferase
LKPDITHALDIGCGTGAWVLDFAAKYQSCHVTGQDLSAIQPRDPPSNVDFCVGDFMNDWDYDQAFDFIHSRAVSTAVKSWPTLIDHCFENLKPGGWVGFDEFRLPAISDDDTMRLEPAFEKWCDGFVEATHKTGTKMSLILDVPDMLQARGFINVEVIHTKWPLGRWAKGEELKRMGAMVIEVRRLES